RRQIKEQAERREPAAADETAAAKQLALLFLVGLFDRPAEKEAVDAVLAPPAITGLTEGLTSLSRQQWRTAVNALRDLGLLAPAAKGAEHELDAHPLVREYFGARLRTDFASAWQAANNRLWRHYESAANAGDPQTVEEMMPAVHAITHAALAGETDAAIAL